METLSCETVRCNQVFNGAIFKLPQGYKQIVRRFRKQPYDRRFCRFRASRIIFDLRYIRL